MHLYVYVHLVSLVKLTSWLPSSNAGSAPVMEREYYMQHYSSIILDWHACIRTYTPNW